MEFISNINLGEIWNFLVSRGDFLAAVVAFITLIYQMRQGNEQKQQAIILQNEENFLTLHGRFSSAWQEIVKISGDKHNELLDQSFSQCKDEAIRLSVYKVIDVLKVVYLTNCNKPKWQQDSTQKEFWVNKMEHVFSKRLFRTAFSKFYQENKKSFSKTFVKKVKECKVKKDVVKKPLKRTAKKSIPLTMKSDKGVKNGQDNQKSNNIRQKIVG